MRATGGTRLRRLIAQRKTHHRFVNTTPNPNATKKSNGELVGPPPPLLPPPLGGAEVTAGLGETELPGTPVSVVEVIMASWRPDRHHSHEC